MAIISKKDQLLYAGRGPLDSKALVKTYAELLALNTWTKIIDGNSTFVAYNFMIVSVWLNTADPTKNGIYFLYDPQVTSAMKRPDVTNPANWHLVCGNADLSNIISRLTTIESELNTLDTRIDTLERSQTETFDLRSEFPELGVEHKVYIALDEKKAYIWDNEENNYISITPESSTMPTISIIYGGNAE